MNGFGSILKITNVLIRIPSILFRRLANGCKAFNLYQVIKTVLEAFHNKTELHSLSTVFFLIGGTAFRELVFNAQLQHYKGEYVFPVNTSTKELETTVQVDCTLPVFDIKTPFQSISINIVHVAS